MDQPLTRFVFAGEAIADLLMRVPALPERGGDMLAESSSVQVGGGFNVMAAAARQGLPVVYAGGHGTGPWGDMVRAALAAEGITVLRPPDPDADTGFDVALVEAGGERTFVTSLGAETLRAPGAWDPVRAGAGDAVYVSGYGLVASGSGAILGAWAAGLPPEVLLFVDPGPLIADIPDAVLGPVLGRCDWWSCNQREATLLTGASDPAGAARRLATRTGRAGDHGPGGPVGLRPGRPRGRPGGGTQPHPRARRGGDRHHRGRRRPRRGVPGGPSRRAAPGRRRPPRQRGRGAGRNPAPGPRCPRPGPNSTRSWPRTARSAYAWTLNRTVTISFPGSTVRRTASAARLRTVTVTVTKDRRTQRPGRR